MGAAVVVGCVRLQSTLGASRTLDSSAAHARRGGFDVRRHARTQRIHSGAFPLFRLGVRAGFGARAAVDARSGHDFIGSAAGFAADSGRDGVSGVDAHAAAARSGFAGRDAGAAVSQCFSGGCGSGGLLLSRRRTAPRCRVARAAR